MLRLRAESPAAPQDFIKAEPPDSLRTPIRKKAMLACSHLRYPFLWAWAPGVRAQGWRCGWTDPALNLPRSSLEPELEEQLQSDMIHSCLHSVMAVLPEPEGEDGPQEVSPCAPRPLSVSVGGREEAAVGGVVTGGPAPPSLPPVPVPGHHARP